jgi:hypothetical protein
MQQVLHYSIFLTAARIEMSGKKPVHIDQELGLTQQKYVSALAKMHR